jgi:hypothetical protein
MVYAAELEAIHMAVTHAKELTQVQSLIFTESRTFSDSQAALSGTGKQAR